MEELYNAPAFIVNLDRKPDRLLTATERIKEAGFTNVSRWKAVNAIDSDELEQSWLSLFDNKKPTFHKKDPEFLTIVGKQGCYLSHLALWKHMIDNKLELVTVFEDDIMFHPQWTDLAPLYWKNTPKNYDLVFIGNQLDCYSQHNIDRVPVYCTHAYVINLQGATKMYELLKKDPYTIDCMMIDHMRLDNNRTVKSPFDWFVWNATFYPTKYLSLKNTGLVFQDDVYESTIVV